ncbi:unnamed protein product [Didymodactylos carnosus]|uniref:Uncharacterized protein n=1 Tax=Didymodactylos carnosus TaxID=1234261 RepID=A0A813U7I2_9BILA|nr:unnamed protein product [Didymodactylos carnosus]CAF1429367.1 unnamed protein product [Didymodactylos carnosus]CAF3605153.1 unnamed protein product [Didymodactylos carnosus]CAF4227768.1 unnamed protein product [Didymodactylos carnosus]
MLFEQGLLGKQIQHGKANLFPTDKEYLIGTNNHLPRQLASYEHKKFEQSKRIEDQQKQQKNDQNYLQKQNIDETEASLWLDDEDEAVTNDYLFHGSHQGDPFGTFVRAQVLDYSQSIKPKHNAITNEQDEETITINFRDEIRTEYDDIQGQF